MEIGDYFLLKENKGETAVIFKMKTNKELRDWRKYQCRTEARDYFVRHATDLEKLAYDTFPDHVVAINFKRNFIEIRCIEIPEQKSRCCGRCDGVNDLCVSDMSCEEHDVQGCEICFGQR